MHDMDLIDCLTRRYENRNWGYDVIRWASSYLKHESNSTDLGYFYNVFRGIGTCGLKKVSNFDDLQILSRYYLVWYKPNRAGIASPYVNGSLNYRLDEYIDALFNDSIPMPVGIMNRIRSFKEGLKNDIDIVIGLDTSINKGLIVDGTKSSLALFYLKRKSEEIFKGLLASEYSINIIHLRSSVCRILFPIDFCRLC